MSLYNHAYTQKYVCESMCAEEGKMDVGVAIKIVGIH